MGRLLEALSILAMSAAAGAAIGTFFWLLEDGVQALRAIALEVHEVHRAREDATRVAVELDADEAGAPDDAD